MTAPLLEQGGDQGDLDNLASVIARRHCGSVHLVDDTHLPCSSDSSS